MGRRDFRLGKKYIERVGDVSDAYDFHFYTKEYWAHGSTEPGAKRPAYKQDRPNMHDQFNTGNIYVWDFGKVEAYLDLVYAHHQATWGTPSLPVIISEFGRQGIIPQLGPWESDYLYSLYGSTVTRMWMTFMDRPEISLTVPFILPESDRGYGTQRGQALYTRPNGPDDLSTEPTPLFDFYGFFEDLRGNRVASRWKGVSPAEAVGLFSVAARDGNQLWVLLHNAPSEAINLNLDLGVAETVGEASIARMRWEGEEPEDFTQTSDGNWRIDQEATEPVDLSHIRLAAAETAIIRVKLGTAQAAQHQVVARYFASATLQPLDAQDGAPATFEIDLPDVAEGGKARLVAGISSPTGFKTDTKLNVKINGHIIAIVLDFTESHRDLLVPVRIDVPIESLNVGPNTIHFQTSDTLPPDFSRVATVRIDIETPQNIGR